MKSRPLLLLLLSSTVSQAVTVDIPAGKDTTLYESADGSLANGAGDFLFTGRTLQFSGSLRRAVIEFDIQSFVPPGAVINSATLTLRAVQVRPALTVVNLHRVTREWKEGTTDAPGAEGAGGTPVTGNDATWLHASSPGTLWSGAGAAGDFDPAPSSSSLLSGPNNFYTWSGMSADVQAWLADDNSNHGWIIIGDESTAGTAAQFASLSNPESDYHPVLRLDYTAVPEPGAAALAALAVLSALRRRR